MANTRLAARHQPASGAENRNYRCSTDDLDQMETAAMIQQTQRTHQGLPVFEHAGARAFSLRLTPAYLAGVQVGYLREACGTQPRYREAGGIRWTGD
jgi:hypothetical protein